MPLRRISLIQSLKYLFINQEIALVSFFGKLFSSLGPTLMPLRLKGLNQFREDGRPNYEWRDSLLLLTLSSLWVFAMQ